MRVANNLLFSIILAAGQSKRMGKQKLILPWKDSTVIETVVSAFQQAGVNQIIVVSGAAHDELQHLFRNNNTVRVIQNKRFETTEMFTSLKIGLLYLESSDMKIHPFFIGLGDQPQIHPSLVADLITAWNKKQPKILIPSYQMRRGHPWMLAPECIQEILSMRDDQTMRDYLQSQEKHIEYLVVDTPDILKDLDTPEDYQKEINGM